MNLSIEQQQAVSRILDWFRDQHKQEFKLGGYAGTGKTTIIKEVLAEIGKVNRNDFDDENPYKHVMAIAICAYTGKAVSVLRKKGIPEAETLHSLMYIPQKKKNGSVEFLLRDSLDADLVIVDEASMIGQQLYDDLKSFDIPILWVGDPGQLEPIGNDIALMKTPDVTLQTIHRQGEGSQILKFATKLRLGDNGPMWVKSRQTVEKGNEAELVVQKFTPKVDINPKAQILCGFNKTRVGLNKQVRKYLGFDGPPDVNEKLVCLRNNTNYGVFNGQLFTVKKTDYSNFSQNVGVLDLEDELGKPYNNIPVWLNQFLQPKTIDPYDMKVAAAIAKRDVLLQFDYGYCLTTHKAQGSEWDEVVVIEEIWGDQWNPARWRYTAATRASKKLTYFYK